MRNLLLVLAIVTMSGCLLTPIRRSAFVPRNSVPANHGAPIGDGGIKAFAQANSFELNFGASGPGAIEDILGSIPTEGAAGLWIPKVMLGAGVYGSPNEYLELGAQASYTNIAWAEPNLIGVLEFPPQHRKQSIVMGGPGLRANIPLGEDSIVTPAFLLEANIATVPQAVFVRNGTNTVDENGLTVPQYEFERIDRKTFILPTLGAHVTVSPFEYLHVLAMFGAQRNVKNIGFDPNIENLENDTLKGYFHLFAGGGIEARYEWAFLTFVVHSAFAKPREIRFGLSGTASLGARFN